MTGNPIAQRLTRRPQRLRCAGAIAVLASAGLFTGTACSSPSSRPEPREPRRAEARDRVRAEELCDRAEPLIATDPGQAEELLLAALDADVFSGRGHNNLGVLYLAQGRLFDAASEFEAARRLLPENPDPRINLGLTLEKAGRIDDALDAYATAHDLNPDHLGAMQALARAQLRYGRASATTPALLEEIALRGDPSWREWAVAQSRGVD